MKLRPLPAEETEGVRYYDPAATGERIQGHQRQLTAEEKTSLKASIDNRYQERAVANGSLMMCEVQGAKEDFIRRWNTIFKEYPDVFEDSDCRKIIHDLTEDAVQYLLKIKEKTL